VGLGGHYVGGLNFPTAIVASEDLRYWYKLYLNGSGYSHFVEVAAQGGKLFAAMGSELLVFALEDVEAAFAGEPFLRPYGAHFDRVRGALFLLRRPARSEGPRLLEAVLARGGGAGHLPRRGAPVAALRRHRRVGHCEARARCPQAGALPALGRARVEVQADRVAPPPRRRAAYPEAPPEVHPRAEGKTAVIYNPPLPLPGAGKELGGEPMFVYAGGSSYVKGFRVLLELLRKAARGGARRPCRFYVVAGRGSEGPLKALSAALGAGSSRAWRETAGWGRSSRWL
jgi:hypothetical protein